MAMIINVTVTPNKMIEVIYGKKDKHGKIYGGRRRRYFHEQELPRTIREYMALTVPIVQNMGRLGTWIEYRNSEFWGL